MNQEKIKQILSKGYKVSFFDKLSAIVHSLSLTGRIMFGALAVVLITSVISMLWQINKLVTVEVPTRGGSLAEGIVGTPRFINPLLAISDADRDLTALVYSGLVKATASGKLVPDLAERYEISEDGLEYTFHIRPDAEFQDGTPLTADDVIFTVGKAQDPVLKSPKRPNWDGVSVQKIDNLTVKINLKQPYSPFLENATIGILPMHIWKDVESDQFTFSQFNIEPVGSGPYQLKSVSRNSGGVPVSYTLIPFKKYSSGEPFIENLIFRFYGSEEALIDAYQNSDIESVNSITPQKASALKALGDRVVTTSLPRVFAVFFNQNQASVFTQREVRLALNESVDRQRIVREVLNGYGVETESPIPVTLVSSDSASTSCFNLDGCPKKNFTDRQNDAKTLLAKNGWKLNTTNNILEKKVKKDIYRLKFSISTSNAPELKAAALIIKENWEKLGAKVELKFFDTGDLNQNVIRPRKYDSLFFGEVIGRDLDLFAFWHSSQRNDPGLNVALYANIKADKLLESSRTLESMPDRIAKYRQFEDEIRKDVPAVFTHSPDFIYVVPGQVQGMKIGTVTIPSERFLNVNEWYIETDNVWKIFAK